MRGYPLYITVPTVYQQLPFQKAGSIFVCQCPPNSLVFAAPYSPNSLVFTPPLSQLSYLLPNLFQLSGICSLSPKSLVFAAPSPNSRIYSLPPPPPTLSYLLQPSFHAALAFLISFSLSLSLSSSFLPSFIPVSPLSQFPSSLFFSLVLSL